MRILIVCGGIGDEREVSLCSGERILEALSTLEHQLTLHRDDGEGALAVLSAASEADAVFLALHGGSGEDGTWQAELEKAGIRHYTGSGSRACALAMQKDAAKRRVAFFGVPTAPGVLCREKSAKPPLPYPFIAKPNRGGSSVGLALIKSDEDWQNYTPLGDFLCETYLSGREFTVGILDGVAMPAVEIRPHGGAYDYAHKYIVGASDELCPAPIEREHAARLAQLARAAFYALGMRDYARIDFRENAFGEPCFLEANALPGMTKTSLFPLSASVMGLDMPALCERMCRMAARRRLG